MCFEWRQDFVSFYGDKATLQSLICVEKSGDTIVFFLPGVPVLLGSDPDKSSLSGHMMTRKGTLGALTMRYFLYQWWQCYSSWTQRYIQISKHCLTIQCNIRASGDLQSVRVEVVEVKSGEMMEVNVGKRWKPAKLAAGLISTTPTMGR